VLIIAKIIRLYKFYIINMPPTYSKSIRIESNNDGYSEIIEKNFIYKPDVIPSDICNKIYKMLTIDDSPLQYRSYVDNFNRIISPKRKTFAIVPDRSFYRYKGKNLIRQKIQVLYDIVEMIKPYVKIDFNAVIFNGYCYNGIDNISIHTDDEKFLANNNHKLFENDCSVVTTITIFGIGDIAMKYCCGDKDSGKGLSVEARSGSILYQGPVLHEVKPLYNSLYKDNIGRISITLRKLMDNCEHGNGCKKISCPYNYGPSNYLYYNC